MGRTSAGQVVGEARLNVLVATDAATLLRRRGFSVVLSRTGPDAVARPRPGDVVGEPSPRSGSHRDLVARDLCADLAHADAVIGMDFDAAASPGEAGSVTLYDAVRSYAAASLRLAELVQREVVSSLRAKGVVVPDLGVHTDVGFGSALTLADREYGHLVLLGPAKRGYLNTPTMAPAALIEPLFLTDPPERRRRLARGTGGDRARAGRRRHALLRAMSGGLAATPGTSGRSKTRARVRRERRVAWGCGSACLSQREDRGIGQRRSGLACS